MTYAIYQRQRYNTATLTFIWISFFNMRCKRKVHCSLKVKVQPALLFSSFVHNSSINELKNMKLSEHICYEIIIWISYYCGFGNSL